MLLLLFSILKKNNHEFLHGPAVSEVVGFIFVERFTFLYSIVLLSITVLTIN